MKSYFVFRIKGESDTIEPVAKISATNAQEAIKAMHGKYKNDWFDDDFMFDKDWTFEDALEDGGKTGGEDSAIFGYLPEMEDSWLITSETECAVFAVEEMQLLSAMMKAIRGMSQ